MTSRDEAVKEAKRIVELYFGLRPNWIDNTPMYDLILSALLRKEKEAYERGLNDVKMNALFNVEKNLQIKTAYQDGWNACLDECKKIAEHIQSRWPDDEGYGLSISGQIEKLRRTE